MTMLARHTATNEDLAHEDGVRVSTRAAGTPEWHGVEKGMR